MGDMSAVRVLGRVILGGIVFLGFVVVVDGEARRKWS